MRLISWSCNQNFWFTCVQDLVKNRTIYVTSWHWDVKVPETRAVKKSVLPTLLLSNIVNSRMNFSHPKSKVGNTVGKNCQIEFIILREIIFASPKDIFLKFDGFFLEFDLQIKLCQNSKNYEIYWMNVPMQSTRFSNKKWIEFKEYLPILLLPYFNLKKCEVMCWYFTIL